MALSDQTAAEKVLRAAIAADPSRNEPYAMLGSLYLNQKKLDEAFHEFEALSTRQAKPVQPLTMMGMILEQQGKPDLAKQRYQEVLALDSRAGTAANNLAWLMAESGEDLDEALRLAQSAVAVAPETPQIVDTLGWVYYKRGLSKSAIEQFQKAIEQEPRNGIYHYHLGLAFIQAGDNVRGRTSPRAGSEIWYQRCDGCCQFVEAWKGFSGGALIFTVRPPASEIATGHCRITHEHRRVPTTIRGLFDLAEWLTAHGGTHGAQLLADARPRSHAHGRRLASFNQRGAQPSCNFGESGASRQTALERLRKNYKCLPAIRFDSKSHRRGGIGVQVEPQRGYSNEGRDVRLHSDLLIRARIANAYEAELTSGGQGRLNQRITRSSPRAVGVAPDRASAFIITALRCGRDEKRRR